MASGLVKWFNEASGYGFIAPDEGGTDLFVGRASISVDMTLTGGERVEFEPREGGMGPEAINVRPRAVSWECDHCSLEPVDLAAARAPSALGPDGSRVREHGRRR